MVKINNYKAIIFDLGNVVFHCSFQPTYEYWAALSTISPDDLRKKLENNQILANFEKGAASPEEVRDFISLQLNFQLTKTQFEDGWNAIYGSTIKGIEDLLNSLKPNYKLIALTNTNITHAPVWREKYRNTLTHFEKVFSSHELKARKSEPESYHRSP